MGLGSTGGDDRVTSSGAIPEVEGSPESSLGCWEPSPSSGIGSSADWVAAGVTRAFLGEGVFLGRLLAQAGEGEDLPGVVGTEDGANGLNSSNSTGDDSGVSGRRVGGVSGVLLLSLLALLRGVTLL